MKFHIEQTNQTKVSFVPCTWNFISTLSVDVVRAKSHVNCLFDPASIVVRITINKFYFVPEWLMSGVVGELRNCGGLSASQSDVSII